MQTECRGLRTAIYKVPDQWGNIIDIICNQGFKAS